MTNDEQITKSISPVIPLALIKRIREYTKKTGVKQNFIVIQALTEYLDREEKKQG